MRPGRLRDKAGVSNVPGLKKQLCLHSDVARERKREREKRRWKDSRRGGRERE